MVQWLVSSNILIVLILCLRRITKDRIRPGIRYALWLLVAVRLLIPVNFGTSILSFENISNHVNYHSKIDQEVKASLNPAPKNGIKIYDGITTLQKEQEITQQEQNIPYRIDGKTIFAGIWILGSSICCLIFFISNLRFRRKLYQTRIPLKEEPGRLTVYCVKNLETPCLFGFFKTAIYVPVEIADDPLLLRHVTAHEESHKEQGDLVWSFIRCLCLSIHWFDPLVWIAGKLSKQDGELSCDARTIRKLGDGERIAYGKTLLQLTCKASQNLFVTATTMTSDKNCLKERVHFIAKKSKIRWSAACFVLLSAGLITACTFTDGKPAEESRSLLQEQENKTEEEALSAEESVSKEEISPEETKIGALIAHADKMLRENYEETVLTYVENTEVGWDYYEDAPWNSAEERDALAQTAMKELYTLTGYHVSECVYTTDGRSRFIFGKSAEYIAKSIAFYSRDYGFLLSGTEVPYIGFMNARRFHYSDVQQLDSPYGKTKYSGNGAIPTWFLEHSGVYQGEKITGYEAVQLNDTVYTHVKMTFDGGYYLVVTDEAIESVAYVMGPYYEENPYEALLEKYYTALTKVQEGKEPDAELPTGIVNPYWSWEENGKKKLLSGIGYSYQDLEGDGNQELLIGWTDNEFWNLEEGYVFAIYTLDQGEPVLAIEGSERSRYVIGNDGYIYHYGSSGADDNICTRLRFDCSYEEHLEIVEELDPQKSDQWMADGKLLNYETFENWR